MARSRTPGPDPVEAAIAEFLADRPEIGSLRVAFSGGRDSTVLLHALSRLPSDRPLDVVHVHHGLHPEADDQARHCRQYTRTLGLRYVEERIRVPEAASEGLEGAARRLRYQALARGLPRDGCVLTAHHARDQSETFLLAALKGSGPSGLSGMPRLRRLGDGWLGRPLLDCTDAQVQLHATRNGLTWVEDPSNTNLRFDRNFLRRAVLPELSQRFPVELRLGTAARLQGEATRVLNLLLDRQLQGLLEEDSVHPKLSLERLMELPPELHGWLLRRLVAAAGIALPRRGPLQEFLRQLRYGGEGAQPELHWAGWSLRCHQGYLYIVEREPAAEDSAPPETIDWPAAVPAIDLPDGRRLTRDELESAGIDPDQTVQIRFRSGGEFVNTPSGRRCLKKMMQERGIPRWRRARLPLVHVGDELVAVLWER